MYENLKDFENILMVDGKAIQSFGRKKSDKGSGNRGERDADWCRKNYSTTTPYGEKHTKTVKWFGFRLHLIADATYGLPVSTAKIIQKVLDLSQNLRYHHNQY